jgi:hypothetical protein
VPSYTSADESFLFSSANNFTAGSAPAIDHSSPSAAVKEEDPFGYDSQMMFDSGITSSLPTYRQPIAYTPQERASAGFNYFLPQNTVSSLSNALANSTPFTTVVPSATFGFAEGDASAYKLSAGIAELSISSPVSSPFFHTASVGPSPTLLPMSQPQPIQVCDPKALSSPVNIEQPIIQAGLPAPRSSRPSAFTSFFVDSDYSPSGESEVEDENDFDYGAPSTRKKNRTVRVTAVAHPYLKPAKAKDKKTRGTKLEIPIPVPGLTKNSRGRGVPTKEPDSVIYIDGTRTFWCSVKDCNKLFARGEHLKRHIKSIHTHDKGETSRLRLPASECSQGVPAYSDYRCECKNTFSRRDNLFQHMRTKGCKEWYEDIPGKSPAVKTTATSKMTEEEDDDDLVDRHVEWIMRDAKIAQEKRKKACGLALARS